MDGINRQVSDFARSNTGWKYREKAEFTYNIFKAINNELFDGKLPDVLVGFDTRLKKAGEYYYEGDSVGLKYHFDVHPDLSPFETVLACLHNAVHAEIDVYKEKATWYHSTAFREEMESWGIEVNDKGHAVALKPKLIEEVLNKINHAHLIAEILDFDPVEEDKSDPKNPSEDKDETVQVQFTATKSKAKMKKWSCSCNPPQNVRCAINLQAQCLECLEEFELQNV
jgi:hypothetical protein